MKEEQFAIKIKFLRYNQSAFFCDLTDLSLSDSILMPDAIIIYDLATRERTSS